MGCELFEIGVLHPDGRMLLRRGWRTEQIDAAVGWRRRENAHGAHVFVRPHCTPALSLVDDLGVDAIAGMTDVGYQPALVVETSPRNFETWLKHKRTLHHKMSTLAAKELATRFGGDLSSADWRHFGERKLLFGLIQGPSPTDLKRLPARSGTGWRSGICRGLKILRRATSVRVRVPPPAPLFWRGQLYPAELPSTISIG